MGIKAHESAAVGHKPSSLDSDLSVPTYTLNPDRTFAPELEQPASHTCRSPSAVRRGCKSKLR